MPTMLVNNIEFNYIDKGIGDPIIFLHGVWMSSIFFQKQIDELSKYHRVIAIDFRGHGLSENTNYGHTVTQYAADVKAIIDQLKLKEIVFVGWSMGAFVIWDYIEQFESHNIKATVIIDESASDFKWDDWPYGFADFPTLIHLMEMIQTNQEHLIDDFLPLMFKDSLDENSQSWMKLELLKVNPTTAGTILFDQTTRDYRNKIANFTFPTLLCFGRDSKLVPVEAGEYFLEHINQSELVVFENSGHCPFLEEYEEFNRQLLKFINKI